jgi:lysophospholipase L1-like esterase
MQGKNLTIPLTGIALSFIFVALYFFFKPVPHKVSYLALGDSYTFSTNIKYDQNYPGQLVAKLRDQGLDIGHPVFIAYPGWTSADLCKAVNRKNLQDTFTFVTLLIGANNQFRGLDLDSYRQQFGALLGKAISYVNGHAARVFVLSTPDWRASPFVGGRDRLQVAQTVVTYNTIIKEMALGNKCTYVDISEILQERAHDTSLFMSDCIHPSPKGYGLWVARLAPVVANVLRQQQLQ